MEVTHVTLRAYIKIAALRGRNVMECHSESVEALGNNALPYRTLARQKRTIHIKILHEELTTHFKEVNILYTKITDSFSKAKIARHFKEDGVAAVTEWYTYLIMAGFVMSSSPVPLRTRRVGQRCTLNLSRAETSSIGVFFFDKGENASQVAEIMNGVYGADNGTANLVQFRIRRFRSEGDRFNRCQVIYSQFALAIHQNDHQARRRFVEWAQNEIAVVLHFRKRILFSDEAHFWLNGYVNKQNCRIWSEANPQVYVETPLHPEKLTVWCALLAGGNWSVLLQKR
ncbi:hypothetical protein TNCV_3107521 [Trichonephila clavipes]|uniref:Transposase n=1 Tax=Trichonephila clavipes TaxID=2585209 RepID=A0A8X6S789_TRICX|nr:hypothetical protein TNCV_3107521 [Trichonephila clavipes]